MHGLFLYSFGFLQLVQDVFQRNRENKQFRVFGHLFINVARLHIEDRVAVLIQVEAFLREENRGQVFPRQAAVVDAASFSSIMSQTISRTSLSAFSVWKSWTHSSLSVEFRTPSSIGRV